MKFAKICTWNGIKTPPFQPSLWHGQNTAKYKFVMLEHSFLYIYEIHLNYATCISRFNTRKNTYGTYFSCPSLEISSTSLSRRLSIAMSTSNRVAILKGRNELLMRTLFIEDLTQWYHGLSLSQRSKQHGEMTAVWEGLSLPCWK